MDSTFISERCNVAMAAVTVNNFVGSAVD